MTTNEPDREAERRQAIDAIRSDLGYTRETIGPVTVEHGPGGSYVVAAPEPPTDLRDALETALSRERAKYGHLYLGNAVNAVLAVVQAHVTAEVERARAEGAAEALKVVADHIEQVWKEADQPFREHELRAAATVGYLRQEGPLILAKYADRIAGGEHRG